MSEASGTSVNASQTKNYYSKLQACRCSRTALYEATDAVFKTRCIVLWSKTSRETFSTIRIKKTKQW